MLLKRICQKIQANMRCLFKIQLRISDHLSFSGSQIIASVPIIPPQPRNYSPHYGMFTIIGGHIDYLTTKLGGGGYNGRKTQIVLLVSNEFKA